MSREKKTEVAKVKRKKDPNRFKNSTVTDYLVGICIANIMLFSAIALYFYYTQGTPPPSEFMVYFFAFFGGELLAMASIKISSNLTEKWKTLKGSDE